MPDNHTLNIKFLGGVRATGTRVLFIHGFGADSQSWAGNAPAVFDFATSLALDLPGHGASIGLQGWHDLPSIADLILQDPMFEQPVHLVGHSVGAAVAVLCASIRPSVVSSLTLIAPLGLGEGVSRSFSAQFTALDNESDALQLLQSLVHNKRLIAGPLAGLLLTHLNKPGAREALVKFASTLHESNDQLQAAFAKIASSEIRRQVFWGKQDAINPMNAADALTFGGDWHYLDSCGHLPHIEHRNFVNTKMCDFVKSNEES